MDESGEEDTDSPAGRLRAAYRGDDDDARLSAMHVLWDAAANGEGGERDRYAASILTARAAAAIAPSSDQSDDVASLIASMLAAGLDLQAQRWASVAEAAGGAEGDRAWAMLAVGASRPVMQVNAKRLGKLADRAGETGRHRTAMLIAGLLGLGRVAPADVTQMAQDPASSSIRPAPMPRPPARGDTPRARHGGVAGCGRHAESALAGGAGGRLLPDDRGAQRRGHDGRSTHDRGRGHGAAVSREAVTDAALIERFLEMMAAEAGAAANTLAAYRRDLDGASEHLRGRLGLADAAALRDLGEAWMPLARSSVARKASALRRFFGFLAEEGLREDDPSDALPRPGAARTLPKVLDHKDIDRLFGEVERRLEIARSPANLRIAALFELLYGSGLRATELVSLPRS
jgi:hypothetical protein